MELQGKYASAKVFTENLEDAAREQILTLLDQPFVDGESIRIMPDVHAGKGCTIGTTMTLRNRKVVPNMVGVDIGCGMLCVPLYAPIENLAVFDTIVRRKVPAGFNVHSSERINPNIIRHHLYCQDAIDAERAARSLGTLGGGNHFIELCESQNEDHQQYLVIHSGSRHLGVEVARYYQEAACRSLFERRKTERAKLIHFLKKVEADKYISASLSLFDVMTDFDKDLAYCEGRLFDEYLHDMRYAQQYAALNRREIARVILDEYYMSLPELFFYDPVRVSLEEAFDTVHNYIDTGLRDVASVPVLRKGACSAKLGERLLIPMNMREGSLLCQGKGNPDWNCSAPHGAGRVMSRSDARKILFLDDYQKQMEGIFTTSVSEATIDEAPDAYKPMDEIIDAIGDTVDVLDVLKPIYNFKAG